MRMYNLFPPLAGPVDQWRSHFERIVDLKFDWVFLNPIQKPGHSGSLYSIADYFDFNPRFCNGETKEAREAQMRATVKAAQEKGLKLMVDLVVNHCASDSALIHEHPQWFRHENGQVAHPFCVEANGQRTVWHDLAQFDHEHTSDRDGLFRYCMKIVDYLLDLGFQGFRCDAAYQLPRDFWQRMIGEVKARRSDVVFAAETLGCTPDQTRETAEAGFDYVFNSSKWWDFRSNWLMAQYNLIRETAPSISFPESHDTPRLCEELNGNVKGMKQRYLFAAFFSSGVMMPMGFEYGLRERLHVVHTSPEHWHTETGIDLTRFIQEVNQMKAEHVIFQEDCPNQIEHCNNDNVMIMWQASRTNKEEALLILNKDPWNRQEFFVQDLREYIQSGAPLIDISPDQRLVHIPNPFHYDLMPGQGIIFITQR